MNKIISVVAIILSVGSASASELFWMISGADNNTYSEADGTYRTSVLNSETEESDFINWNTATLYANNIGGTEILAISAADLWDEGNWMTATLDNYSSADSFIMELKDSAGRTATTSVAFDALEQHFSLGGGIGAGRVTPYAFDNFAGAVPEPTTGLLMLFGLAGLALRRRRA